MLGAMVPAASVQLALQPSGSGARLGRFPRSQGPALRPLRLRRSMATASAWWPAPQKGGSSSTNPRRSRAPLPPPAAVPSTPRPLPASAPSKLGFSVLFTDLDGTCVHYNSPIGLGRDGRRQEILQLPPSKTGGYGVISVRTLQLYSVIRQLGVKVAIITGARLSTTLQRLPFLPFADAIVAENGGRVFFPGSLPTAAPLQEDSEWRRSHEAAGPPGQDAIPPEERIGPLWEHYAAIKRGEVPGLEGCTLDATSYTTSFRLRLARPEQASALAASLPRGLVTAGNLGAADVYPATSGKAGAALHLLERWGYTPADAVFMCDDDNDLALARIVKRAFLPGITADTMRAAVEAAPAQFHVSSCDGVWGTEELLELLISEHLAAAGPETCNFK